MPRPAIAALHFHPPVAVARVGGSGVPLEAFSWSEDPRSFGAGSTVAVPEVSMEVLADGSLEPYLPRDLRFKDGSQIRPVCPFLELHVELIGRDNKETHRVPLTRSILQEYGLDLASLTFRVEAANLKAARRTGDPACGFEARELLRGDDNAPRPLLAYSHAPSPTPLVFHDHPVPLGQFQVIRPAGAGTMRLGVPLDTIRVRFTPGQGEVYGPPRAIEGQASDARSKHVIVPPENRILNPNAAWTTFSRLSPPVPPVRPSQTYDGEGDIDRGEFSWGVVDDTCEASVTAALTVNGQQLTTTARILVGPPQYAPDKRPFYSLADELADRDPESVPKLPGSTAALAEAVQDLFRRVLETASTINLERQRSRALEVNAQSMSDLGTNPENFPAIDENSMTDKDRIGGAKGRDLLSTFAKDMLAGDQGSDPTEGEPLQRWKIASEQHQQLAQPDYLIRFLLDQVRVHDIIRPPYARFSELAADTIGSDPLARRDPRNPRSSFHDMRMPPYMRDAYSDALSITPRQWQMIQLYMDELAKQAEESRIPKASPAAQHAKRVSSRRS